jgi:flagellar assembly protein FliH
MKWSKSIPFSQPPRDIRLLTEAPKQDWEEIVRQREHAAYERGRRDGESGLGAQLIQQRAEMAELQQGILSSLRRAVPQVLQESETALLALTLEAVKKVVADIPITPELVESVVRDALQHTKDTAEIVIQLHPEDLALLRKQDETLLASSPEGAPLKFVASGDVTRGGCVLQTRFGIVDARREVKLEQIAQTLAV